MSKAKCEGTNKIIVVFFYLSNVAVFPLLVNKSTINIKITEIKSVERNWSWLTSVPSHIQVTG